MLYKVVLSFESVDEILKCDHGQDGSQRRSLWMKFQSESFQIKATEQYFPMFNLLHKGVLTIAYAVEIF